MAYWLDDGFDTWPETVRAGSAAAGLYIRCGTWISRNLTDGLVPGEVALMYGTPEWVRKLVEVGLWAADGTGYRDLRYFPLNPTAEAARAKRAKRAEAGRKGGLASGKQRATKRSTKPQANASTTVARSSNPLPPPSTKGEGGDPPMSGEVARALIRETTTAARKRAA